MSDTPELSDEDKLKEQERQIRLRGWAECRADLEVSLGLPKEKRAARIEELIAQGNAEWERKRVEIEAKDEPPRALNAPFAEPTSE